MLAEAAGLGQESIERVYLSALVHDIGKIGVPEAVLCKPGKLSPEEFERILTEPHAALTEQYRELLKTEGLHVEFLEDGIKRIAEISWSVNEKTENIGARRLHTVLEKILDEVAFDAPDKSGQEYVIDAEHVDKTVGELSEDEDLSRYIL